jgi:quinol monooxygenase YgiN
VVQLFLKLIVPAGQIREVTQALQTIMLPARLSRGCSRAELCKDVEPPEALCYLEEWDVEEALLPQLRTERISQLLELMECASEPPFLEFRFVSSRLGLDYIAAARSGKDVQ